MNNNFLLCSISNYKSFDNLNQKTYSMHQASSNFYLFYKFLYFCANIYMGIIKILQHDKTNYLVNLIIYMHIKLNFINQIYI